MTPFRLLFEAFCLAQVYGEVTARGQRGVLGERDVLGVLGQRHLLTRVHIKKQAK